MRHRFEFWDRDTGNIISTFDTLIELVQAAVGYGQANPSIDLKVSAIDITEETDSDYENIYNDQ